MATAYSKAWKAYQKSIEYKNSISVLEKKGIEHPFNENILQSAFSMGFNDKSKSEHVYHYLRIEYDQQITRMEKLGIPVKNQFFEQSVNGLLMRIEYPEKFI